MGAFGSWLSHTMVRGGGGAHHRKGTRLCDGVAMVRTMANTFLSELLDIVLTRIQAKRLINDSAALKL